MVGAEAMKPEEQKRITVRENAVRIMIVISMVLLLISMALPWYSIEYRQEGPGGDFYFKEDFTLSGVNYEYDVPGDNATIVKGSKDWSEADYPKMHASFHTLTILLILAVVLSMIAYISLLPPKSGKRSPLRYVPAFCTFMVMLVITLLFFSTTIGPAMVDDAGAVGKYEEEYVLNNIRYPSGQSSGHGSFGETSMEWGPGGIFYVMLLVAFIQPVIFIALQIPKGKKKKPREFGEKPEWTQRIDRWKPN